MYYSCTMCTGNPVSITKKEWRKWRESSRWWCSRLRCISSALTSTCPLQNAHVTVFITYAFHICWNKGVGWIRRPTERGWWMRSSAVTDNDDILQLATLPKVYTWRRTANVRMNVTLVIVKLPTRRLAPLYKALILIFCSLRASPNQRFQITNGRRGCSWAHNGWIASTEISCLVSHRKSPSFTLRRCSRAVCRCPESPVFQTLWECNPEQRGHKA